MAREQYTERRQDEAEQVQLAEAASQDSAASPTQFVTQGPIPPVETASGAQMATASERAYGKGPGVQALEKLLEHGTPKADQVVSLIDAHRDEHDAMLSLISDKLGAAF